jgi:hypothetical protein
MSRPQPSGCGIRPGIAERLGRRQHALAHLFGHQFRPAERLRSTTDRDACMLGNIPQAYAPRLAFCHIQEYYAWMNRFSYCTC